jgi:CHAT domain-containing protein
VPHHLVVLFFGLSYVRLNTTTSKGAALQGAQSTVMQMPRFAHPYYWAAFVMAGSN